MRIEPTAAVAIGTAITAPAYGTAGYKTPPPTAAALRSMSSCTTTVVDLVSPRSAMQLPSTSPNRFHRLPPGAPSSAGIQTPIQKNGNISLPRRDLGGAKLLSASYDGKSTLAQHRDQFSDPWALVWAATTSASMMQQPMPRSSSYLSQYEVRRPHEASRVVAAPRSAPSARSRFETKLRST